MKIDTLRYQENSSSVYVIKLEKTKKKQEKLTTCCKCFVLASTKVGSVFSD